MHGRMNSGQAMIETVIAVVIITFVFLTLFKLSHLLTGKILLEHAAMRVARAKAVGFNEFIGVKAAQVSVIPVAGRRLWPEGDQMDYAQELASVAIYMGTPNAGIARGVLEYEGWHRMDLPRADGKAWTVRLENDWFDLTGSAVVEDNFTLYMNDEGR